jgi:hypothetical protein
VEAVAQGEKPKKLKFGLTGSNISTVLSKGKDVFVLAGNAVDTWKALGEAADAMNGALRTGTPCEPSCRCTDAMRLQTIHYCEKCFRMAFCKSMVDELPNGDNDASIRIYQRCVNPRQRQETPLINARANFKGLIAFEQVTLLELPVQQVKDFFSSRWNDEVMQNMQPFQDQQTWKFRDAYSNTTLNIPSERTTNRIPMTLSYDACFPYYEFRNSTGGLERRIHCHPNLWLTTLNNNLGKHDLLWVLFTWRASHGVTVDRDLALKFPL